MNLNRVTLIGYLAGTPELRKTTAGLEVCTVYVATHSYWNDKQGKSKEKTVFHRVTFWGKLANIVGTFAVKGQQVYVDGELQHETYTNKAGLEIERLYVNAHTLQLGQKPNDADTQSPLQDIEL